MDWSKIPIGSGRTWRCQANLSRPTAEWNGVHIPDITTSNLEDVALQEVQWKPTDNKPTSSDKWNVYDQFGNTAMRYPSHLPYHYDPGPPPSTPDAHDVGWTVEDTVMTKRTLCADGRRTEKKKKLYIYYIWMCQVICCCHLI